MADSGRNNKRTDREMTPEDCSPDTSSCVSPQKKRNHSDTETDITSETDSPDSDRQCKRVHYDQSESSLSRTDSESPVFLKNIPKYTSKWTEEVLPCLRIQVAQDFPDMHNVFLQGCLHFIADPTKCAEIMDLFVSKNDNEQMVIECFRHVMQNVFTLHCDDISNVKLEELGKMENMLTSREWIDNFAERSQNKKFCRRVFKDLAKKLQQFVWQLMHMVRKSQNQGKEISEGMYQELFVLFAKTFNLNILSGSNVEKYSLDIGDDGRFVAVPDAVICHPTTEEDNLCAVVEVKKYWSDEETSNQTVRSLRKCERKISNPLHVGSDLQGQHVGQILCALPYSLFGERGNFGILVQGTKVTISSFKADNSYYKNLQNGFLMKKGATITFSKECNILRKEGRIECIQTFLHLKKLLEFLSKKSFP